MIGDTKNGLKRKKELGEGGREREGEGREGKRGEREGEEGWERGGRKMQSSKGFVMMSVMGKQLKPGLR